MNINQGDLYQSLGLDRSDDTQALRTLLSGRDAQLEIQGFPAHHPQRQQLQTAYSVLGEQSRRAIYDAAIDSHRQLSWHEIEHLGNFGKLPEAMFPQPTQAQPGAQLPFYQQTQTQQPFPNQGMPSGFAGSLGYPLAQSGPQQHLQSNLSNRPSAGLRLLMMVVDMIIFSVAAGVVGLAFFWSDTLTGIVMFLAFLLYFLGLEFKTGATPAKHLFGYEVRDLATGGRPSLLQSGKRQLWRLVAVVPGIGWLISFIGAIYIGASINQSNQYLGKHDTWAGTEVTRKR
ncbi:RDD family protein [Corynebacterium sp. A21]|uniref:RDD family protein n=1 Tax=Corynebacterium sp. A21 TaxID=3457318 RepID=UPI003FD3B388